MPAVVKGGRVDSHPFGLSESVGRHVHGQVAERIGRSIVQGEIQPGAQLPSEIQIGAMLGVSRPVVREALRVLIGKGFLEARPKSGTRVKPLSQWNFLDSDVVRWQLEASELDTYLAKLYQLRQALDPAASAIAATSATKENLDDIRAACEDMAAATDNDAFVAADIAFHQGIYLATHNEFFYPVASMFDVTLRMSFGIAATGTHRKRAIAEHRALTEAITDRDPQRAREATTILLDNSADDLVTIRGHNPFRS